MKVLFLAVVIVAALLPVSGNATTPAHSPNYCGPVICLELDLASRLVVETVSVVDAESGATDIKVSGQEGRLTIHVRKSNLTCRAVKRLVLRKADSAYSGSLLVNAPSGEFCKELELEYLPNMTVKGARLKLPVTNVWLMDDVPSSFWSNGYALRIGAGIEISIQD